MIADPRFSHERMFDRTRQLDVPELWSSQSQLGMVATAHYLATAAGIQMLENGGNAVDAAVAAAFALGVCEPAGSGIGGMAMLLIHEARASRTFALAGPCRAPRSIHVGSLKNSSRYRGYPAIAVPSNVATLARALESYGSLSPEEVLTPAITMAERGYPVTSFQDANWLKARTSLERGSTRTLFVSDDGRFPARGSWLRQPVLAKTLRRLASHGFQDFYHGEVAREMARDIRAHGGFVDRDDLEDVPRPVLLEPLQSNLGETRVYSLGPPGGGSALIEILNIFHEMSDPVFVPDSPEGVELFARIIRRARRDRRRYARELGAMHMGTAMSYLQPRHTHAVAAELRSELASSGETSHVSVMDAQGNAVTLTQSIERSFGAAVASPTLGFLYNGFMRAFNVSDEAHPHFLAPNAVARSNACPTLLIRDGKPIVAVGSTGSERMASGIFQVLVRLGSQSPFAAVHAPRLHCTPEGVVYYEERGHLQTEAPRLTRRGLRPESVEPYAFMMGGLQIVTRDAAGFVGVADPRRDGAAGGPRDC